MHAHALHWLGSFALVAVLFLSRRALPMRAMHSISLHTRFSRAQLLLSIISQVGVGNANAPPLARSKLGRLGGWRGAAL